MRKLTASLSTTVRKLDFLKNKENRSLLEEFLLFLKNRGTSERHQSNTLKAVLTFSSYLGTEYPLREVKKEQVMVFLDTKIRNREDDPESKWITTWNDYMLRIKHFYRWLHNSQGLADPKPDAEWINPPLVAIRKRKTKRLSPYSHNELWDREELLAIVRYESYVRNKAALTLFWDLDARNHEVTMLKIKHLRLREKYAEGEIPHEAKTGSGPILLTISFPFVRDWLNLHPNRNDPDARLICNLYDGTPVKPDAMWRMMKQLRRRISRLLEKGEIRDPKEREHLEYLLRTKRWNPYCLRHSAITHDSDYLPGYALNKKVRWSMNSRQPARYIKNRMGESLKNTILEHNGIHLDRLDKPLPVARDCPRCSFANALETQYCSKCSYPLTANAYEDIKTKEERTIQDFQRELMRIQEENNKRYLRVMSLIRQNPVLLQLKPEELAKLTPKPASTAEENGG